MFHALIPIASRWLALGEAFPLSEKRLDDIDTTEGDENCLKEMVDAYMLRSDLEHTWEDLVKVLRKIREDRLADKIYKEDIYPCMLVYSIILCIIVKQIIIFSICCASIFKYAVQVTLPNQVELPKNECVTESHHNKVSQDEEQSPALPPKRYKITLPSETQPRAEESSSQQEEQHLSSSMYEQPSEFKLSSTPEEGSDSKSQVVDPVALSVGIRHSLYIAEIKELSSVKAAGSGDSGVSGVNEECDVSNSSEKDKDDDSRATNGEYRKCIISNMSSRGQKIS